MSAPRNAGSQPRPILTWESSGRPPLTRETVWFFWRLTRPLSRLIFPAPTGAGAGAAGGAGGAAGAAWAGAGPPSQGETGWETGGAGGAGGTGGAAGAAGAAAGVGSSSTETPKSVAMPARPLAYPWPTARTFHTPPRW